MEFIQSRMYGLLLGSGVFVGAWVVAKIAKREKIDPELVWDGLLWVVVAGVVGARAYHVIDLWSYYSQNLGQVMAVWNGGLGIFGALIGGVLGLLLFVRNRGLSSKDILSLLDVAVVGVPIGQAIGRWGNYFNQELYGKPTNLPWGVMIGPENRLVGYESFSKFHPLFLYESLLSLGLFLILWSLYRYGRRETLKHYDKLRASQVQDDGFIGWKVGSGKFLGIYLAGYGVIRLVLESWRLENWKVGDLPVASIMSVVIIVIGSWLVVRSNRARLRNRES